MSQRRVFATVALSAVLPALHGCSTAEAPVIRRPNVVLVTVDTLRADHLGCYGYSRPTSPTADALAEAGTRFADAVVPIPETLPSIVSIFTGTYPIDHRVRGNHEILGPLPTLAERLASRGWRTAGFVSSVVLEPGTGVERGFEVYDATLPHRFLRLDTGQRRAEATTDAARGWLEQQVRSGRRDGLFLWVHYIDPHAQYDAPPPWGDRFVDPAYAGPVTGDVEQFFGIVQREIPVDAADVRFLADRYDGEIAYAAAQFGRLLEALDALGLDDTLVVYTADHGESLGEHDYYFDHGEYLYDDQLRVPLIVRHPELPAARVVDDQVEIVDILPTILEFVGIAVPDRLRGRSLLPLVRAGASDAPRVAFSESATCESWSLRACGPVGVGGKLAAVRRDGLKFVYDPQGGHELYDLRADPGETIDRVGERAQVELELGRALGTFLQQAPPPDPRQRNDAERLERLRGLGYVR